MKIAGIYRILNLKNGKSYIGSSVNVEKRWKQHKRDLCNNKHHSPHLQYAWNKYREDSFSFELLWKCEPDECLYEEQLALNNIKCEYNVCSVAGSTAGRPVSDETRAKLSATQKGKVLSDETKAKMSAANKGKKYSAEHKAKMSAAQKGNKKALGRKQTAEHKAKISAANKIKLKATREDGLIIYFESLRDADRSGFPHQSIWTAIKKGRNYKGFHWEKVGKKPA